MKKQAVKETYPDYMDIASSIRSMSASANNIMHMQNLEGDTIQSLLALEKRLEELADALDKRYKDERETTMQISEDQAWEIYGAIKTSNFEQGVPDEDDGLMNEIFKKFPNIKKEIDRRNHEDYVWSVVVERDQRVVSVRNKLSKEKSLDKMSGLTKELFKVKEVVRQEIHDKELKTGKWVE